jgi:hypothetical protein
MNMKDMFPSTWLGQIDVPTPIIATIREIKREPIKGKFDLRHDRTRAGGSAGPCFDQQQGTEEPMGTNWLKYDIDRSAGGPSGAVLLRRIRRRCFDLCRLN